MNKTTNNNGFTLIEVIISLAIVGLISIAFISMFTSGYMGILSAGNHSVVGYEGQAVIESYLENIVSTDPNASVNTTTTNLNIDFVDGSGTVTSIGVDGELRSVDYEDGKYDIKISTFVHP